VSNVTVISAAQSQIGGPTASKYITYFGGKTPVAWCAMFAGWCVEQAGWMLTRPFWGNVDNLSSQLQAQGWVKSTTPTAGAVFINPSTHTGLVEQVTAGKITTIEGNTQSLDNWAQETVRRITRTSWSGFYFLTPPAASTTPPPTPSVPTVTAPSVTPTPPTVTAPAVTPTLKQGSTGDAVKTLQSKLVALGVSVGASGVDGSFGPATLAAVKTYQAGVGLTVDGIVGPNTWAKLNAGVKPATGPSAAAKARAQIKQGASGALVKDLQTRLIQAGYSVGASGVDGSFGPATNSAVRAFQKAKGLTVDGIVGPNTWTALGV
jgi:peptidoglycan hydrolase-like protein with peptidoglycan-binding domain